MTKTPEELAEEYGATVERVPIMFYKPEQPCKNAYLAGYQAARDQLADRDKVMCNTKMEEIKAVDTGELMPMTNLPTSAKWISVKERLPEVGKEILWYHEPGEEFAIGLLHDGVEKPFFTHWMPLPEAPKEEK